MKNRYVYMAVSSERPTSYRFVKVAPPIISWVFKVEDATIFEDQDSSDSLRAILMGRDLPKEFIHGFSRITSLLSLKLEKETK